MSENPKTILITGASGGIGQALADKYATANTTLLLTGRNEERLENTAQICMDKGAAVHTAVLDILDAENVKNQFLEWDTRFSVDLVIANAGVSAGPGKTGFEEEKKAREVFETNVTGVLNTIHPLISQMVRKKQGQIAIISSLASFCPMPTAPAYSASKAAVRAYGESLRPVLAKHGIFVSVVCPGFIKTPLTDVNEFPMPFLMNTERAAHIIHRGIKRRKTRIAFPWPMYFMTWLLGCLPPLITHKLLARVPNKT